MQGYDSHGGYDFIGPQQQGLNGHKVFMDGYNQNAMSLLAHHNNPKANGAMMQQSHPKFSSGHPSSIRILAIIYWCRNRSGAGQGAR